MPLASEPGKMPDLRSAVPLVTPPRLSSKSLRGKVRTGQLLDFIPAFTARELPYMEK
jgi:hypothetical protein